MPTSCDGWGDFCLTHALVCCKGGLVTQHHDEVRDSLGGLAALWYREVVHEPIVCDEGEVSPTLIADLEVRGVWIPTRWCLVWCKSTGQILMQLLISIILCLLFWLLLKKGRNEIFICCWIVPCFFTIFVVSGDGALGPKALMFLQCLSDWLSGAWGKSYGHVLMWINFAAIQATSLCFHGSCVCWQGGSSINDGAGLPYVSLI